jgi:precorrin-6B methylase 2
LLPVLCFAAAAAIASAAEEAPKPFVPVEGQAGKDVVWVPTPHVLIEKMLDLAMLTEQDFVMDLGSGDGRAIIAAARRGARGIGVEYNPAMVELARRTAEKEGVADKAQFVQGDMYEADISKATVLALFLLPSNLDKLAPKFLTLKPGTRIVNNTFTVTGWQPDATEMVEGSCTSWCTAHFNLVPARVAGTWQLGSDTLTLTQEFQMVSGTLGATAITGKLLGEQITFKAGETEYSGRLNGDRMEGTATTAGKQEKWRATKKPQ